MGTPEQRPRTGAGIGGIDVYAVPDSAHVDEELLHESIIAAVRDGEISLDDMHAESEFLDLASDAAVDRRNSTIDSLDSVLYSEQLPQGGKLVFLVGKNRRDKPTIKNFADQVKPGRRETEIRKAARFETEVPKDVQPITIEVDPDDLGNGLAITYAIEANLRGSITDDQLALIGDYLTLAGDRNINLQDKIRYDDNGKCYLTFIFPKN